MAKADNPVRKKSSKKKDAIIAPARKKLTKKEIESKKVIAYALYMAFEENKTIAEVVDVTPKTIGEWAEAGKWKTKRTAGTITRDELVNKLLSNMNIMLDKALQEGADANFSSLSDQLIKMTNAIEKLDKKNNVVNTVWAFKNFNTYLLKRMQEDKSLSPELVKQINTLQNDYVTLRIGSEA